MEKLVIVCACIAIFVLGYACGVSSVIKNAEIYPYGENAAIMSAFGEEHIYEYGE